MSSPAQQALEEVPVVCYAPDQTYTSEKRHTRHAMLIMILFQTLHMLRAAIHTTIHVVYCSTLSLSYQLKGTHAYASPPVLDDSDLNMHIQAVSRDWVS